ncbi:MAG TPA: malectin domain-containing carbohydrate-binding protein [Candidatus Hydrogenedentes bacterium]|nr:malectin domain-containing carbohydrate-binding protein [Candidatus Hydrogenedentota bacterium]
MEEETADFTAFPVSLVHIKQEMETGTMKKLMSIALPLMMSTLAMTSGATTNARVDDAYARIEEDEQHWSIGTDAVQMQFGIENGQLQWTHFKNLCMQPAHEYVIHGAPFALEPLPNAGTYSFGSVWSKSLAPEGSANLTADALPIPVKQGDLIGFGAVTFADTGVAEVHWINTVEYEDGSVFSSTDDPELTQGPVWYFYSHAMGTGYMDLLDEILSPAEPDKPKRRVPAGYRAPGECSRVDGVQFKLMNAYELLRVWKAPKDGAVTLRGTAKCTKGNTPATLNIYRIQEASPSVSESKPWIVRSCAANYVTVGGRSVVQLDLVLTREALQVSYYLQAYPGTSVLRQLVKMKNTGEAPITLETAAPFALCMKEENLASLTHYWMYGGTSRPNQGVLDHAELKEGYHRALLGEKSDNYVPWLALQRTNEPADGLFAALDYLGTWTMSVDCGEDSAMVSATIPSFAGYTLAAGETLLLPMATFGVFQKNLDDMGRRLYDWQYEYLWDYTNEDFFARTKWVTPWFFCSRNLQEQFAARLANLDMGADLMRTMGMETLWDDAGWSKYPGWPIPDSYSVVFSPSNEGPDYGETLRYLDKMGMNWLVWMAGRTPEGVMDTKVGSWGNFQWRTDGFGKFTHKDDAAIRVQLEHFLTANPRCSFHTCDGGSRYAHQFEIQRFADVNYLSDLGRGPETNHYFSYLEVPDKWLDILDAILQPGSAYNPATTPAMLTMAPGWYAHAAEADQESFRRLMEIYRYLRREGVAGRWSYMMHPVVKGDTDYFYDQRINYQHDKSCIIGKHPAPEGTVLYPQGLLPERRYNVALFSQKESSERSGADLMENGIALSNHSSAELIFLGLPNRPGSGNDTEPPKAPGNAHIRFETNLGHSGIAVYWASAFDNQWISYYEVQRDDQIIGKASVGAYYFDHSAGWNAKSRYAVRSVDGDGNVSDWTPVQPLPETQNAYAALGGHFSEAGRDGWQAESTTDGQTFSGMTWVPPAKNPAGDFGGTPNQPGGVEGYWEGPGGARVGRGWQQTSTETMCVRAWTAPADGVVRILGRAMKECYHQAMGEPLRVHILTGTQKIWPETDWAEVPPNNLLGVMHDLSIDVTAGNILRFVLDRGTSPENDLLAWMPRIEYKLPQSNEEGSVVRIQCGAEAPYTDHTGNTWERDQYFNGGVPYSTSVFINNAQPTTDDQALYQFSRLGNDFTYEIPVTPGLYSVRLKWAETAYKQAFEGPMNVEINDRLMLQNFDVCHAARGPQQAYDHVFRHIVPNAEGKLKLRFTGGFEPKQKTYQAMVQAIEVLPEAKSLVRIDAGSETEFIDWNGHVWSTDAFFDGGTILRAEVPVSHASPTLYDQALYHTARNGPSLLYQIPVRPGIYGVHLKFAELWLKELGQRPMNITINGRRIRENWDPATAAGQLNMAADIRAEDVTPGSNGMITLQIQATGNNDAILQGIEIE